MGGFPAVSSHNSSPGSGNSRASGLKIATIAGMPIRLSWSWWIFALIIVVLFVPLFRQATDSTGLLVPLLYALGFIAALFIMVLVHELGHGITARAFGWQVHEISLNIWGGLTTFTDTDPKNPATPGRSLLVSLAGPFGNILLALLGHLTVFILNQTETAVSGGWALLLSMTIYANWLIAIFNLLPGHPLDGGRIVESAVWKATGVRAKGYIAAGWAGRIIVVLLVLAGLWWVYGHGAQVTWTFWLILLMIAAGLWQSAGQGMMQGRAELKMAELNLASVLTPVRVLNATATVADLDADLRARYQAQQQAGVGASGAEYTGPVMYLVAETLDEPVRQQQSPRLVGAVDQAAVQQVPPTQRALVPIRAVTQQLGPTGAPQVISASATPRQLMDAIAVHDGKQPVLVADEPSHQIIGMIFPQRVLDWINSR